MITVHSLAYSRAMRVVWLLEELRAPYKLKTYARTEAYRAPPELKAVHPLGKSPVIEEGALVLGESAAILRYVDRRHGAGRFSPAPGSDDEARHDEWLDYVEGTLARPVIAGFWAKRNGAAMEPRMQEEFANHMAFLAGALEGRPYLMGERLMLADIQISYLLAMADYAGALATYPEVEAYWRRLSKSPALIRALEKTGPIMPPSA